jgi:hypothetical protein
MIDGGGINQASLDPAAPVVFFVYSFSAIS